MERDEWLNSENDQSLLNNNSSKRILIHAYFIQDKKNNTSKWKTCMATPKSNEYLQYLKDKEHTALSGNLKNCQGKRNLCYN
jgi:hypothetical protein